MLNPLCYVCLGLSEQDVSLSGPCGSSCTNCKLSRRKGHHNHTGHLCTAGMFSLAFMLLLSVRSFHTLLALHYHIGILFAAVSRFRTSMCRNAASCKRSICFFAHNEAELRSTIYSCSAEEADTPAAASEHSVAAAAAEAAGLACADEACPTCVTRQLLAIQQCIDGDQLMERMQEVVNHLPSKASSSSLDAACSDAANNCSNTSEQEEDASKSGSAAGSPAASSCDSPAAKSQVCCICLGPMFDPSQMPRAAATVPKAASVSPLSCDTVYGTLDQRAAAVGGEVGLVEGSWEGLPVYLQQLLDANGARAPAAAGAPGGWDVPMPSGFSDPIGFDPWGNLSETQGSFLAAFGWGGPLGNEAQGPQGLAAGLSGADMLTAAAAGRGASVVGQQELLMQQANCSNDLWAGLLENATVAAAPSAGPVAQQNLGLQGLGLGSQAPTVYSSMSLSPASSNSGGSSSAAAARVAPSRSSSGSSRSTASAVSAGGLDNMSAMLNMLSAGPRNTSCGMKQQQQLLPPGAGLGGMVGAVPQQHTRNVPTQAQQQQQLLLEAQMGLGGLGFQGWAQPVQARGPAPPPPAAGFGSFMGADARFGHAGWPVGQEQEPVVQWLASQQQQQAGIGRMDPGLGLSNNRSVGEAQWWGNVQEMPRVGLY